MYLDDTNLEIITQEELENVLLTLNDTNVDFNVEWLWCRVHEVKAFMNKETLELLWEKWEQQRINLRARMSLLKAELAILGKDLKTVGEGKPPDLSSKENFLKGLF